MKKKWKVKVERVLELEFEMTEDDLEGESPDIAAEELALSYPDNVWNEIDMFVDVVED